MQTKLFYFFFSLALILSSCFRSSPQIEKENAQTDSLYRVFTDSSIKTHYVQIRKFKNEFFFQTKEFKSNYSLLMRELVEANTLWREGEIDQAIDLIHQIIAKSDSSDKREIKVIFQANLTLGEIYYQSKNSIQSAAPYFLNAIQISQTFKTPFDIANLQRYLGYLYYRQSDHLAARKAFKTSFNQLAADPKLTYDRAYFLQEQLDNIALTFLNENNYDSANYYFDSTLNFIDLHLQNVSDKSKKDAISIAKGNKARSLLRQGKTQEGRALLRENYNYLINTERYKTNAVVSYYALTSSHIKSDSPQSGFMLDSLLELFNEYPVPPLQEKLKKLEANFYAKNDPEKAINLLNNYVVFKDSLYEAMNENSFRSQVAEQQIQLAKSKILLTEKEKESNSQLANLYLFAFFAALLLLLATLYFIRRISKNNEKLKKLNAQILHQKSLLDKTAADLQEKNEMLEFLDKQKSGILSIVAHDLKNPVDAIVSAIELIENGELSEGEQKEFLELVKISSDNVESILHDLVIYSNLERNGVPRLIKKRCKTADFILPAVKILSQKSLKKKIEIKYTPNQDAIVLADIPRASRMISNLVSNAIKFSQKNSTIEVIETVKSHQVEISVIDNGIGIPKEKQEEIFNPFNSFRRRGTNDERSTGLGLSIVKSIAKAHNAQIKINSEVEKGTSITLVMDLAS